MKSPYVSELQPNQTVTACLLVSHKDVRQKKSGEPYLSLSLSDRTGEIEARMWDNAAEVLDTFERDDYVQAKGLVQVHQNRLQLTVHRLQRMDPAEVDATDYFPSADRPVDEMLTELRAITDNLGNAHLRALLQLILADEPLVKALRLAPAAKTIHHAYLGGLLEHILSMCHLARLTALHYRDVDLDLLLAGVVLHDIGKVRELTYDRSFGYSIEGQLLGHITIGLGIVHDKIARLPEFPPKLRLLLEHMILSHHGELEFGSPKVPLFPEALLLHHLDNLDSKMEAMRTCVVRDRTVEGCFTSFSAALDRSVLKKQKYLTEAAAVARPSAPPAKPAPPKSNSPFAEKLGFALRKDA